MVWAMAASAAVSAVGGMLSSASASKAAAKQVDAQNREIARRNREIADANVENTIRTGYRVGLLNMQVGQSRMDMATQGFSQSQLAQQALGAVHANQAAAGAVGASADAVADDVRRKLGEARASAKLDWDLQLTNFNTELTGIIQQGQDSIQGATGDVARMSASNPMADGLLTGTASFASSYASRSMSLGLGQAPQQGTGSPWNRTPVATTFPVQDMRLIN